MSTAEQDRIVRDYAPLVKRIASHMMARLPASVNMDDLVQAGLIGLLDAAGNYDPGQNVPFERFAGQRIRGAMLDELREIDWLPRSVRRNYRRIEAGINELEQKLGRPPAEQEMAATLGISLADYRQMLQDARGHQLIYYEDFIGDGEENGDFLEHHLVDDRAGPLATLEDQGFRRHLVDAIAGLPEREKLVMALYYDEELTLREIGEVLGVTESRVCQIHSQAIARVRGKLKDWL
jgi:RNA polymerase sigma factor FliA